MSRQQKPQVSLKLPRQKQTVMVDNRCGPKGCCPTLSAGCDLCTGCSEYYLQPMCASIGITGMLNARPCIQYDEYAGSCGDCIGCQKDCGPGVCAFPGYMRPPVASYR